MALRRISNSQIPILRSVFRSFHHQASATVEGHSISFTVVDKEGVRHHYRGLEGYKLHDVLAEIDEIRDSCMICAPGGRGSWDTHLYVTKEVMQQLPRIDASEAYDLQETAEDTNVNSRMASSITLTKELDGAVFALGNVKPWMTR